MYGGNLLFKKNQESYHMLLCDCAFEQCLLGQPLVVPQGMGVNNCWWIISDWSYIVGVFELEIELEC